MFVFFSHAGIILSLTLCMADACISLLSLVTFVFSLDPTDDKIALIFFEYLVIVIAMLFTPVLYFAKLCMSINEVCIYVIYCHKIRKFSLTQALVNSKLCSVLQSRLETFSRARTSLFREGGARICST